ncbi:MAG: SLOG family protein [Clostridia bacterium]
MGKTACFTGHRPKKLPWGADEQNAGCRVVKLRIMAAIYRAYEEGFTHFISGMAQGIDILAAELVVQLRQSCPLMTLECALPYRNHADNWALDLRARHSGILAVADGVTVLAEEYSPACMAQRNRYMVSAADRLIAVYSGGSGGTANTIHMAEKQGLDIVIICPDDIGG